MAWEKELAEQAEQSVKEVEETEEQKYNYMLLGRLKSDCEYYINTHETETNNHLWAKNPTDQIKKMQELYNAVPEKPEWLSQDDIQGFAEAMGVAENNSLTAWNKDGAAILVEKEITITPDCIERYGACEKDCYTLSPEQDVLDEILNRISSIEVSFTTASGTQNYDTQDYDYIIYVDTDENQSFVDLRASSPDLGFDVSVPLTEKEKMQTIEAVCEYEATYTPPERSSPKKTKEKAKQNTKEM